MARDWNARPAPRPTSITECARRYAACGQALARVFGVPFTEAFVKEFHEAIACVYIEAGRAGVRLPATVTLPPLGADAPVATPTGQSGETLPQPVGEGFEGPVGQPVASVRDVEHAAEPPANPGHAGEAEGARSAETPVNPGSEEFSANLAKNPKGGRRPRPDSHAPPTTIPADGDLPCAGQEIATLKPAALVMLIAKTARLVQDHQDGWVPLLHALQAERQGRVDRGRKPPVAGEG